MRLSTQLALPLPAFLALPALSLAATNFDCENVLASGQRFNLKALGGPHVAFQVEETDLIITNRTFAVDLCQPLKIPNNTPDKQFCPNGARVCGIVSVTSKSDNHTSIEEVLPIAGDFIHHGKGWDPQWSLLSRSRSHQDAEREGLLIEFNGGKAPWNDKNAVKQTAIMELVCNKNHSDKALDERSLHHGSELRTKDDDDGGDDDDDDYDEAEEKLSFVSYKNEDGVGTLRLTWVTKHACYNSQGGSGSSQSGGWGFFTWFLIILFLSISAYLIFGSWLNYNRYGARGWDLVPHGDSIRDVPYLMKDWGRRVVNTVQGGGTRGNYSAI